MQLAEPKLKLWAQTEYHKMSELGWFCGGRVELIEGEIVEMSPQASLHAAGICLVNEALRNAFGPGFVVRIQLPMDFGAVSEPEPDVAVVSGTARDHSMSHPKSALLIVEISDSTLRYDRSKKASLYAKAGVEDYWVLNLPDRKLELHRKPIRDDAQVYGYGYSSVTVLSSTDSVAPMSAPLRHMQISDLLP